MASTTGQISRRPVISVAVDCTCNHVPYAPLNIPGEAEVPTATPDCFRIVRKSLSQLSVVSQVRHNDTYETLQAAQFSKENRRCRNIHKTSKLLRSATFPYVQDNVDTICVNMDKRHNPFGLEWHVSSVHAAPASAVVVKKAFMSGLLTFEKADGTPLASLTHSLCSTSSKLQWKNSTYR